MSTSVKVNHTAQVVCSVFRRIAGVIAFLMLFMPWIEDLNFFAISSVDLGIYESTSIISVILLVAVLIFNVLAIAGNTSNGTWGPIVCVILAFIYMVTSPVVKAMAMVSSLFGIELKTLFSDGYPYYIIAMVVVLILSCIEKSFGRRCENAEWIAMHPANKGESANASVTTPAPVAKSSNPNKYWHCYQCGTSNIVAKNACVRCGMPKPIVTTTVQSEPEPINQGRKIWKCPHCNVGNSFANPICSRCGYQPDEDARLCSSCGAANRGNNKFCNKCGALIE